MSKRWVEAMAATALLLPGCTRAPTPAVSPLPVTLTALFHDAVANESESRKYVIPPGDANAIYSYLYRKIQEYSPAATHEEIVDDASRLLGNAISSEIAASEDISDPVMKEKHALCLRALREALQLAKAGKIPDSPSPGR
jgi:hypothetical protein